MSNEQLKDNFVGIITNIYYSNDKKFKQKLNSFELCFELLQFTSKYLAKKGVESENFQAAIAEFVVIESIIDPYNLVSKIKDSIGNEADAQALVQNNFDYFLL